MKNKFSPETLEQLKLMLASASVTLELLQKQLTSANAMVDSLSGKPSNEVSAEVLKEKEARDTSRWKLDGDYYPKGRFLLVVFQKYVEGKMSLKEVKQHFNPDVAFAGQTVAGNRILYQLAQDVKDAKRFHMDEKIKTTDGKEVVVSNQFGIKNFPAVLRYLASHFGIPLKMEYEEPYSNAWKGRLEV